MNIFNRKKKKIFFTPEQHQVIIEAIKEAERNTSGEIKVHVESVCQKHPFERGLEVFSQLEMQLTRQRNGVLFYLAMEDKKFAIIADEGINSVVDADFWDEIKEDMQVYFTSKSVTEGLVAGILKAGNQLNAHFPYGDRDENEIGNDISMGD